MTKNSHVRPHCIQMELTEGCNRRCGFCGIHSLYREKQDMIYKFMQPDLAKSIAIDLAKWLPKVRIEFAMQGEPLLNRQAPEIFRNFRTHFPTAQLMCTSNMDILREGQGFNGQKILNLFRNGLNMLVADYYGEKNDMPYEQFLASLREVGRHEGIRVLDFYKDNAQVWAYKGTDYWEIIAIDNTFDRNMQRYLNNQAGNTRPEYTFNAHDKQMPELPQARRCQLPFREMAIKHDGAVAMCCMDWGREHLLGKFPEKTYKEIWEGLHFHYVRKLLYQRRRDLLNPCNRCDYRGYKVGLLDDPEPGVSGDMNMQAMAKQVYQMQKANWPLANKYAKQPFVYNEDYIKRIGLL